MTSRFFNNIFYLEENKTILKSSTDFTKIQSEFFFYKNLSNNLKPFFPHVYSEKKIKEKINEIEMEFVPYPNLSEIFVDQIINSIKFINLLFRRSINLNDILALFSKLLKSLK